MILIGTEVETVGDETYDPRLRLWYRGAVEKQSLDWSDIYIFFGLDLWIGHLASIRSQQTERLHANRS